MIDLDKVSADTAWRKVVRLLRMKSESAKRKVERMKNEELNVVLDIISDGSIKISERSE